LGRSSDMKRPRINQQIQATEVRVIDDEGRELGVLGLAQALKLVASRREDLVEIQPQAVPPVCQAIDYGKFRYRQIQDEKGRWS
jgi:translation initiation factor IF-3